MDGVGGVLARQKAGDDLAGVPAHGDAVGVVTGGEVQAAAGVAADEGETVFGFGAEAGPDGGQGAVGQCGQGGEGVVEHFLDGAGAEAAVEAGAFLGGADEEASVGPLEEAGAGDVEDVAQVQVRSIEGEHVAPGGDDGGPGQEVAQPGAGGEDDVIGGEIATDGLDGGVGAGVNGDDVGSFVDVDAGGEQGAMDDGGPALDVDLAVGVEGGAGEVRREQGFEAAGVVGLEEFDLKPGPALPVDAVEEVLALLVGAGEADGGAAGEADGEAAEVFEVVGEVGEGVAPVESQTEQGRVVVGVVLSADEAAGGG